jgi:hypothetical protein
LTIDLLRNYDCHPIFIVFFQFPTVSEDPEGKSKVEDRDDRDDEKPVVVVLADGDLTAEEVEKNETLDDDQQVPVDHHHPGSEGKIIFKKPTKRTSKNNDESEVSEPTKKSKKKQKPVTNLLSFDQDEEEDFS